MQKDNQIKQSAPTKKSYGRELQRQKLLDVIAMLWSDKNTPPIEGICRDISESGILIELADLLPIGTALRVSLHSNQNREHLQSLNVRVVRAQKNKWGSYTTGFVILQNSSEVKMDTHVQL